MKPKSAQHIGLLTVLVCAMGALLPARAAAQHSMTTGQQEFLVRPVAEKKVTQLPSGPWYWLIENFPTMTKAQAAAGPTSLPAEVEGKVWLFTLGPKDMPAHGGSKVAEIGPVVPITAPEYLLRINHASGAPGAKTKVHTHPGSETFYVLTGQLSQKSPQGVRHVDAGQSMAGRGPDMPMQVSSTGATEMNALVMFVVDSTRPFSSPAKLP